MLSQSKSQASKARVPREGGDPEVSRTERQLALIWIPAFAGNSAERKGMNPPYPGLASTSPRGGRFRGLLAVNVQRIARRANGANWIDFGVEIERLA